MIQKYFGGVGNIHTRKADGTVYYNISSVKDIIKYVIPHFDSYPFWGGRSRPLKRKQTISYLGK